MVLSQTSSTFAPLISCVIFRHLSHKYCILLSFYISCFRHILIGYLLCSFLIRNVEISFRENNTCRFRNLLAGFYVTCNFQFTNLQIAHDHEESKRYIILSHENLKKPAMTPIDVSKIKPNPLHKCREKEP